MSKKHDLPYMPFYWGDWFKAMDLQSLPRETRCVWFEMLGRMWESNERGYLTINGKPMSDFAKANALAFGSSIDEYLKHERILEESGIFSRRESDGAIYSRKVLNDLDLSNIRAKSGSKGGKKTWSFAKASAKASAKANTDIDIDIDNEVKNTTKKPTIEEVRAYCQERNNGVDPQKWHDFYTAKDWMIGKNKMKDWKAAVRTWEKEKNVTTKRMLS